MRKFLLGAGVLSVVFAISIIWILDSDFGDGDTSTELYTNSTEVVDNSTQSLMDKNKEEVKTEVDTEEESSEEFDNTLVSSDINIINSDLSNTDKEVTTKSSSNTSDSSITIDKVEDIIKNLMSIQRQDEMTEYLSTINKTSDFVFMPVVNKDTRVAIEHIGMSIDNPSEYLAIVTLRQDNGISKFSVIVKFEGVSLKSFIMSRF